MLLPMLRFVGVRVTKRQTTPTGRRIHPMEWYGSIDNTTAPSCDDVTTLQAALFNSGLSMESTRLSLTRDTGMPNIREPILSIPRLRPVLHVTICQIIRWHFPWIRLNSTRVLNYSDPNWSLARASGSRMYVSNPLSKSFQYWISVVEIFILRSQPRTQYLYTRQ